jgi:hypothetical protein
MWMSLRGWAFMLALTAGAYYLGQNYRIAGLDRIRLVPRDVAASRSRSDSPNAGSWLGGLLSGGQSDRADRNGLDGNGLDGNGLDGTMPYDAITLNGAALNGAALSESPLSGSPLGVAARSAEAYGEGSGTLAGWARPSTAPNQSGTTVPWGGGSIGRRDPAGDPESGGAIEPIGQYDPPRQVRLASMHCGPMTQQTLADPELLPYLLRMITQFDALAISGIPATATDLPKKLLQRLRTVDVRGASFDALVGPKVGPPGRQEQFIVLYNTSILETDRTQLYTISDPHDQIAFDPMVAWFRSKNVPANIAWTFSLVSIRIDPERGETERDLLPELARAIQRDGRGEDDVILAGHFAADADALHLRLGALGWTPAVAKQPTDVLGTRAQDNLLVPRSTMPERTGNSGVFDFLRRYNLTIEQAEAIAPSMPVWSEFEPIEGS